MSGSFNRTNARKSDVQKIKTTVSNSYNYTWDGTKKPPSLEATKYNRYGARSEGIGSVLDSKIVARNIEREKENLGDGFIQLQIVDDGSGNKNKPLNIGNRLHYADEDGRFTIIDEKYISIMKQREQEKREYIEGLIETAIMSDEICAVMLGTDEAGLKAILGGNGTEAPKFGIEQNSDLHKVDARPSAIETYSESSQAYANAIQKFKMVLKNRMPIVNDLTPAKALNE